MSRPWITSHERRGIIVLLAIIAICAGMAGMRHCSSERHARILYHDRQAHLDSVTAAISAAADTILITTVDTTFSVGTAPSTHRPTPQRKRNSQPSSTSSPLPVRNPMDEPVN